mgnify:CR=1 FL=1
MNLKDYPKAPEPTGRFIMAVPVVSSGYLGKDTAYQFYGHRDVCGIAGSLGEGWLLFLDGSLIDYIECSTIRLIVKTLINLGYQYMRLCQDGDVFSDVELLTED